MPDGNEGTKERRMTGNSIVPSVSTTGSNATPSSMYVNANPPAERMTFEQFAYWLQGFMELSGTHALTERHVRIINDHLAKVFNKQTPTYTYSNAGPAMPQAAPMPFGGSSFVC